MTEEVMSLETTHAQILRDVELLRVFADGDPTINLGDYLLWKAACFMEDRQIPPAEFKARPKEEVHLHAEALSFELDPSVKTLYTAPD